MCKAVNLIVLSSKTFAMARTSTVKYKKFQLDLINTGYFGF